ncbi:DNA gyrase inhibitor YacG [Chitinimonas sp. BJYL2]|uniref:DNA gyrase inhibitor YacG n=1 Tax=Chitinimonas sp. BJYL2 TaxID=2976696 RepID=UPI0022B52BB8|nr:DNA gyrase inhibitor YacG [Chitinimonas sp. BJYL2]
MPLEVDCPQCGTRTPWNSANPSRPFCSERCKLIDLGLWANEQYRVPGEPLDTTPIPPEA